MKTTCFWSVLAIFVLSSFTLKSSKENVTIVPGVYSLSMACGNAETIQSGLIIRDDHTFGYFDKGTNQEIEGTWTISGSDLLLQADVALPVSSQWKIEKNGKCMKARMGFAIYRSCNC